MSADNAENDALREVSAVVKPAHTAACPSGSIRVCECPARAKVEAVVALLARAWDGGYYQGVCDNEVDMESADNPYVIPPGIGGTDA